ncbi:uncharacterized protein LOC119563360 [Drosophila subpulchrella]|uniref:uncharacterized protein LOC119563360 n=1 Tax=Drosophila subpulchrella TaxID=1486046 RepID=UPI0018A19489|nr:uncharacterized protein LOC119563360 [Drosophila subpulchrella]
MWQFSLVLLGLAVVCWADTLVQLHVNRPYNDVNEKFVSFAVRPEDLYDALDGKNRKAVTNLANLLGDAHIKFVGDFYFASNAPSKLRNPTKIIWKGFNRWTRAVNWTMIIPVPYAPDEWDSMHTLKILNTSYMVGITDCIWQLGTDFGTARAKDYVQELRTLKLMTDTFKPYVDDWRMMGADISAGSSADETKRYVDMSKDLNTAFGWTQPANMVPKTSLGSYIYDNDPALRTLRQQRVPLWLTLPEERSSQRLVGDETTDALRWAQTLGDAATSGFDVVFKRMTLVDFERPNFGLYVTALFKKVMGSRVFPSRPLNAFAPSNKLYTHCANAVSGGLAFMVVNTEEQPTTITVKSPNRLTSSEIWQYVLTGLDQRVQLNNVRLHLNTTLRPLIKPIDPTKPLQLITPSMSVSFWVLPDVNLEHCQFTEIEAGDSSAESSTSKEKRRTSRYSSADRLLQRLIEETAVAKGSVQSSINRNRRFVVDKEDTPESLLDRLLQHFKHDSPPKREVGDDKEKSVKPHKALAWLYQVLEQTRDVNKKRSRRSTSSYSGPFFYNRQGKKTALTKKITEIRKPERKNKPLFDFDEFDEEKFFKRIGEKSEETPTYTRLPEGDVHLKHIESVDGEENEQEAEPEVPRKRRPKSRKELKIIQRAAEKEDEQEQESEPTEGRAKLRLLPTEFFEALPAPKLPPSKRLNLGATLNSLLFPEPFSSKATMAKGASLKSKPVEEPEEDVDPVPTARRRHSRIGLVANDFLQAQQELGKHFLSHINEHEHEFSVGDEGVREGSLESESSGKKFLTQDLFGTKKDTPSLHQKLPQKTADEGITSWWDLPAMRRRRAVPLTNSLDELPSNAIDKADRDEMLPLGRYTFYEYKVDQSPEKDVSQPKEEKESKIMKISSKSQSTGKDRSLTKLSESLVSTVKSKVSRFINIISNHMNEWYNTLTKHLDSETEAERPRRQNTIEK